MQASLCVRHNVLDDEVICTTIFFISLYVKRWRTMRGDFASLVPYKFCVCHQTLNTILLNVTNKF